jgi:hypothetical protein
MWVTRHWHAQAILTTSTETVLSKMLQSDKQTPAAEDEVSDRASHFHVVAGDFHDGVQPGCRVPGGQDEELVGGLIKKRWEAGSSR